MSRQMKDSGVAWIGNIPVNWSVQKVKNAFYRSKEEAHIEDPVILSLARSGVKIRDISNNEGQLAESYYNYNPVVEGDLLLNPMDLYSGANCSISKVSGVISPAYINLRTRGNYCPAFYDYYFKTQYWAMALFAHGKGVSFDNRWTLSPNDLFNYYIPVPNFEEQKRIAEFLDCQCAEIDAVIAKTSVTIEEYKKLKQSIITEAVTKGIRGNRTMKDSGIDWIGEVPIEREIIKIKYITNVSRGLFNHRPRNDERYYGGDYPFIQTGDVARAGKFITTYSQTLNELGISVSKMFPKGTMTMTIAANIGDVAILGFDAYFPDSVVGFTPKEGYLENYIYYVFCSLKEMFIRTAVVSTQLNLNIDRIKEIFIPITRDKNEQMEIADYLDKKCAEIDTLIEKKTALLAEMENYKKSVIYEYVTGKKECQHTKEAESVAVIYPYFPAVFNTDKVRFAQAVLMSKILDSNVSYMGRVKLEKMLFTIEHCLGFDFNTEYRREAAGPLDSSIYECEKVISRANKWFYVNSSKHGTSYKPQKDMVKYKKYYEQYFSEHNEEIERIISIFKNYSLDQSEMVATLYGVWNDFIIDKRPFTDDDIVTEVLTNWNESKKRFSKDVWLRAIENMRQNNLVPKGYGRHTVIKEVEQ